MQRAIKNVVILGSGVMGSRIACHFAGIGVQVVLLDRLNPGKEESTNKKERNQLVNDALTAAIKSNPASTAKASISTLNGMPPIKAFCLCSILPFIQKSG